VPLYLRDSLASARSRGKDRATIVCIEERKRCGRIIATWQASKNSIESAFLIMTTRLSKMRRSLIDHIKYRPLDVLVPVPEVQRCRRRLESFDSTQTSDDVYADAVTAPSSRSSYAGQDIRSSREGFAPFRRVMRRKDCKRACEEMKTFADAFLEHTLVLERRVPSDKSLLS